MTTSTVTNSWSPIHSNLGNEGVQTWLNATYPGVKIEFGPSMPNSYFITSEHIPNWWTKAATLEAAQAFVAKML